MVKTRVLAVGITARPRVKVMGLPLAVIILPVADTSSGAADKTAAIMRTGKHQVRRRIFFMTGCHESIPKTRDRKGSELDRYLDRNLKLCSGLQEARRIQSFGLLRGSFCRYPQQAQRTQGGKVDLS